MIKATLIFISFLSAFCSCVGNSASSKVTGKGTPVITIREKSFDNQSIILIPDEKSKSEINTIEFENCTFSGLSSFTGVKDNFAEFPFNCVFKNCSFEGDIMGMMTLFKGNVNFLKCRFKKKVNFQNSTFFSGVGFRDCTFDGPAEFQNTIYFRESTWMGSNFYDIPFFQSSRFYLKAQFMNAVFHGNSDFTICRFMEGANFDFVRSEGNLDFTESKIEGLTTFRKAILLKRIVLKNISAFSSVRFVETSFSDSLIIIGSQFFGPKMEVIKPSGLYQHLEN